MTRFVQDIGLYHERRATTFARFFSVGLRLKINLPNLPAQHVKQDRLASLRQLLGFLVDAAQTTFAIKKSSDLLKRVRFFRAQRRVNILS